MTLFDPSATSQVKGVSVQADNRLQQVLKRRKLAFEELEDPEEVRIEQKFQTMCSTENARIDRR